MKTTECKCEQCGINFDKPTNEYNRKIKLNKKFYCSRQCSGKAIGSIANAAVKNPYDISKHASHRDEYTGLREFIRRAKNRNKLGNIDIYYLKELWDKQNGVCPYSGIKLRLPSYKSKNSRIFTASLDRIDSSKLYERDNVQFVSTAINLMKNDLSHEETLELCRLIGSQK